MERLSKEKIKACLGKNVETEIKVFDIIDSTNTQAKLSLNHGLNIDGIFVAEGQTDGRGRVGKSFYSPENSGLYLSIALKCELPLEVATGFTPLAAVAVVEALKNRTNCQPKIKWVNDIFIDNKKVCGILTESVFDNTTGKTNAVIIGIGINLTTEGFPEELKDIAGSVGVDIDKNLLVADLYSGIKKRIADLTTRDFMNDYRKHSLILSKQISFSKNGIDFEGIATDILDDGSLAVTTSNGEKILLNSGEVSIKI